MRSPRTKTFLLFVACVLLFATILIYWYFAPAELLYKGHPFSYWLDDLPVTLVWPGGGYSEMLPNPKRAAAFTQAELDEITQSVREAEDAVNELGEKHLQALAARVGTSDSSPKYVLLNGAYRFHLAHFNVNNSPDYIRGQAVTALVQLGPHAKAVVPRLVALAQSNDPNVRASARHVLEQIAPGEIRKLDAATNH